MKLSEFKNEQALEVLADIIEPAAAICADKELAKIMKNGGKKIAAVQRLLREHKSQVIEILAALERVPVDEYQVNILTLPMRLMEILGDRELMQLFQSRGQSEAAQSSGSASDSTVDREE